MKGTGPEQTAILEAIEQFALTQGEQYAALCADQSPDFAAFQEQRQKGFRRLQHHLEALADLAGLEKKEFVLLVRDKIGELLAAEQQLAKAVQKRRQEIGAQLALIRRGRQVLAKFSVNRGGAALPRFLSNRA